MNPGTPKPNQHIPGRITGRQQPPAFGGPHGKPSQIIIIGGIHAGHLGGLTAHQGAARLAATFRNAADHGAGLVQLQLCGRELIPE